MVGYIYLITDTLHNKQYVGQRRGYKLDENYYGSGRILQDLIKKDVTIDIAQDLLKDTIFCATGNSVSMETILKVVANIENTSIADIKGKKRNKKIAETRHIAIYIARELLEYSYPELGNEFGGRDHSTILSAYNNIADRIKTDPSFDLRIKNIINSIKEYKKI